MTKKPNKLTPEDFGHEATHLIDVDTLAGDLRDAVLSHLRAMTVPWGHLNENEQRDKIYAATEMARDVVRKAVNAIANRGFPHVQVGIGKMTVDKGIDLKVTASGTLDNVQKIVSHGKMGAVLVLSEASEFFGERAPAKPSKDEPKMFGDDEE